MVATPVIPEAFSDTAALGLGLVVAVLLPVGEAAVPVPAVPVGEEPEGRTEVVTPPVPVSMALAWYAAKLLAESGLALMAPTMPFEQ